MPSSSAWVADVFGHVAQDKIRFFFLSLFFLYIRIVCVCMDGEAQTEMFSVASDSIVPKVVVLGPSKPLCAPFSETLSVFQF